MTTTTIELLAEQLANLTVKEVNDLAIILSDKYGIKPSQITSVSENIDSHDNKKQEKSNFDIILKSPGSSKLKVIKAVKELLGKSLTEAKDLVDSSPKSILKHKEPKESAELLKKKFEELGAKIDLV